MTWGEAYRLARTLSADPSTALCAALAGWAHPVTREAMALMDLYDLQHTSKAKRRPRPYPRPWGEKTRRRLGGARLSPAQLRDVLDQQRDNTT